MASSFDCQDLSPEVKAFFVVIAAAILLVNAAVVMGEVASEISNTYAIFTWPAWARVGDVSTPAQNIQRTGSEESIGNLEAKEAYKRAIQGWKQQVAEWEEKVREIESKAAIEQGWKEKAENLERKTEMLELEIFHLKSMALCLERVLEGGLRAEDVRMVVREEFQTERDRDIAITLVDSDSDTDFEEVALDFGI